MIGSAVGEVGGRGLLEGGEICGVVEGGVEGGEVVGGGVVGG